jgi:hypothetical protein
MTIFNILIPLTVSDGYYIKIRLKCGFQIKPLCQRHRAQISRQQQKPFFLKIANCKFDGVDGKRKDAFRIRLGG